MDTTVGQDMNSPTNIVMLFLVFFLRRKKKYIYWKVRILLCADEDKQRTSEPSQKRKRYERCI